MSVSILTVVDETDVADRFRQHLRREVRESLYVPHFAYSAEEALVDRAADVSALARLRVRP